VNRYRRNPILPATLSLTLTALAAAGLAAHALASGGPSPACTASVLHPIQVRVIALDPVRHGAELRLQVTATSRVGLGRTQVRMTSDGGATRRGASAAALGTVVPGRAASTVFTVKVPESGNRFYVQFQVTGDGPRGPLTRGACYNILPDGPLEVGRVVDTADGRHVLEVPARRID